MLSVGQRGRAAAWVLQKPEAAELQALVAPVGASMQAAQALTEGRRGAAFNHYKAAAEALQALSWVVYSGPSCGGGTHIASQIIEHVCGALASDAAPFAQA